MRFDAYKSVKRVVISRLETVLHAYGKSARV
jgi:hypothetical protein